MHAANIYIYICAEVWDVWHVRRVSGPMFLNMFLALLNEDNIRGYMIRNTWSASAKMTQRVSKYPANPF